MKVTKRLVWAIVLVVGIAALLFFFFAPSARVKSLVNSYNHWTDPRLIEGQGIPGLIKFFFMSKYASFRLKRLISPDCKITGQLPDGTETSNTRDNFVAGFTGTRFVSTAQRFILKGPVIEKNQDRYLARMTRAFQEGHTVNIIETELVISDSNGSLLICEIRNVARVPRDDELDQVRSMAQRGRYDPKKGLGGLNADSYSKSWLSFSPDGKKIVFSSLRHKSSDVYIVNVDGSDLTRLTNTKYWEVHPSFTPDGKSILFVSDNDSYVGEPYLIDIDGSNYRRLVPDYFGVADTCYSSGGSHVAFTSQKAGAREVFIMKSDGSEVTCLTKSQSRREASSLVFSPDGAKIYYKQRWYDWNKEPPLCEEIFSVSIDGSDLRQLTYDRQMKTPLAATPKQLLYQLTRSRDRHYDHELYLTRPDGTGQKCVLGGPSNGMYYRTRILPRMRHIVFVDDRDKAFRYHVYIKELYGEGRIRRISDDNTISSVLAVSQDSKYVAYMAMVKGQVAGPERVIRIAPLMPDGGEIRTICNNY